MSGMEFNIRGCFHRNIKNTSFEDVDRKPLTTLRRLTMVRPFREAIEFYDGTKLEENVLSERPE